MGWRRQQLGEDSGVPPATHRAPTAWEMNLSIPNDKGMPRSEGCQGLRRQGLEPAYRLIALAGSGHLR